MNVGLRINRRRFASVAIGVVAFSFASAGSAFADVRSGYTHLGVPSEPPSLEPRAPITERSQLPDVLSATYDSMGTVSVSYRPYSPAAWAGTMPDVSFALREHCDDEDAPIYGSFTYRTWTTEPFPGEAPQTTTTSEVRVLRRGYDGQATGTVGYDGQTFTATATHQAFAGLKLRCVQMENDYGGSDFNETFWFAGHSPTDYANRKATRVTVGPSKWSDELYWRVKPSRFGFWGDSNAESGRFIGFRWSRWARDDAVGRGYGVALHGYRNRRGKLVFDRYKVRIRLSRSRLCGETWVFTRMRISSRWGSRYLQVPNAC